MQAEKNRIYQHIGLFRRIAIEPDELMRYEPKMQEILIKKQIVSDIVPPQVAVMIGKMNHMSAEIVNVLNDMDYVKTGITDFKEGYYATDTEPPNGKQL